MNNFRRFNKVLSRILRGRVPIITLLKSGFLVITDVITFRNSVLKRIKEFFEYQKSGRF